MTPEDYFTAKRLALSLYNQHYEHEGARFSVLPTMDGVLSQIDNMTAGMLRGWRPINTAPKSTVDTIQVWNGEWVPKVTWDSRAKRWCVEVWDADWRCYERHPVYNVTHWMPQPSEPRTK